MNNSDPRTIHNQQMSTYLRIKPRYLLRAREVIDREFGAKWLNKLISNYQLLSNRTTSFDLSIPSYHPIYHGLLAGTLNQLTLEIIELATYLEHLRKTAINADKALAMLLEHLKNDKLYQQCLFQLMITGRFSLISPSLTMEPSIKSTRPDISFRYKGRDFVIEATKVGLPEKTKNLTTYLERVFMWFEHTSDIMGLNLRLTLRTLEIMKYDRELKSAFLEICKEPNTKISTAMFDLYSEGEFNGSIQDLYNAHFPLIQQGKELVFGLGKTSTPLLNSDMSLPNLSKIMTIIADFTLLEDSLYKDITDKIDTATREKLRQLRPLWGGDQEIMLFIDIGEILASRPLLDISRVIARLNSNIFRKYPRLFSCIVLVVRRWNEESKRHQLSYRSIFDDEQRIPDSFYIMKDLQEVESQNDFIGEVMFRSKQYLVL